MLTPNNNYTITSVEYIIPENSVITEAIGQAYMELLIVPDTGYTVDATSFSLATPPNATYVSSVVFTQAGANVLVIINLVPSAVMPAGNLYLGICISGRACQIDSGINGIYNTDVEPQITPSSESNVPYSASGEVGDLVTLFSKTFTASSNFYIIGADVALTQGNAANYSFEENPQFNSQGLMTSITYVVKYLFTAQSYSDDVIDFTLRSKLLPLVQPIVISSYSELPNFVQATGENKAFTVFWPRGSCV